MRTLQHSLRASDRGTAAIETALVFPVFILMVLGVFEFGRALWTQSALQYAVQVAARCGAVDVTTCASPSQVISYAVTQSQPLSVPSADFSASTQTCGSSVSVSYPFTFVVPHLFPFDVTFSAQACYPTAT
jgi:Flp pilus assembly protein TadG